MSRIKKQILSKLKEYASKMGTNTLGGDDYTSNRKGGLRDFDGYDNVDYNRDMPMDEAYIVLYSPKKGVKPVATAAYRDKKDAQKWAKDLGGITMIVKKKMKGVDEAKLIEACWKGYKAVGGKIKNGKQVPNCVPESVDEGKVDRVVGHTRYKYVGDGRKGKAIVSGPMKDREKEAIIKRAKKAGYSAKPNMGGGVTIHVESVNESMFSMIDQIRQDSKDVRDFVKNVFKDREFKKMSNDKEFIKYLKSIYEGINEAIPQNFHQGRTSDYHTALRGKNRDYSGGTNFKKKNHGQPDVEEDDEDQETNHLSNKQTHIKSDKLKVSEYGQRLDLSFIEDEEAKLDGTPEPKDAIDTEIGETAKRDYKDEYKKFQSSTKSKKYRAELNKYNRKKGTYGNGDGKDASHKGGKIVGFESASKNRGRKEKSRLKKK